MTFLIGHTDAIGGSTDRLSVLLIEYSGKQSLCESFPVVMVCLCLFLSCFSLRSVVRWTGGCGEAFWFSACLLFTHTFVCLRSFLQMEWTRNRLGGLEAYSTAKKWAPKLSTDRASPEFLMGPWVPPVSGVAASSVTSLARTFLDYSTDAWKHLDKPANLGRTRGNPAADDAVDPAGKDRCRFGRAWRCSDQLERTQNLFT